MLPTASLDSRLGVRPTLWWLPAGEREGQNPSCCFLEMGSSWERTQTPKSRLSYPMFRLPLEVWENVR